VLLDIGKWKDT